MAGKYFGFNSGVVKLAIEAVVDIMSPDYHPLAKQAKDMGGAAVILSFLAAMIIWGIATF